MPNIPYFCIVCEKVLRNGDMACRGTFFHLGAATAFYICEACSPAAATPEGVAAFVPKLRLKVCAVAGSA